jgi:hypothetical protein
MTSEQLQSLRELNQKLEAFLVQMNQPALLVSSDALAELLKTVVDAGAWITDPLLPPTELDGEAMLHVYRSLLERLRGVLPLLEVRLRMERAQLESERSQLAGAAQWTAATRDTFSSR